MRRTSFIVATAVALATMVFAWSDRPVHADDQPMTGTWSIDARHSEQKIDLTLQYRDTHGSSEDENTVPWVPAQYPGLSEADLTARSAQVHFSIVRDSGSFACSGTFSNGLGGGVFTFEPSASFAAALAARGIGTPTAADEFEMAMTGITLATVDALRAQHVSGLTVAELVRMGDHGVDEAFVNTLAANGLHPTTAEDYVRLVDHGVTVDFVNGILHDGFHPSADDLVQLVDHGVTLNFVSGMLKYGYQPTIDDLVRLADHGVTLDFVANLKSHGYSPSIDDLIRLRDSGM